MGGAQEFEACAPRPQQENCLGKIVRPGLKDRRKQGGREKGSLKVRATSHLPRVDPNRGSFDLVPLHISKLHYFLHFRPKLDLMCVFPILPHSAPLPLVVLQREVEILMFLSAIVMMKNRRSSKLPALSWLG